MKVYKFRIYPSKNQEQELNKHLWLSKNLWNELLEANKINYINFGYFLSRNTMQKMAKYHGLYAQVQMVLVRRLDAIIMRYFKLKKQNKKVGFPRFKSSIRMKSLNYPQNGFWLNEKLKVTPFGEISIKKHREIEGKIKTLTLKKQPSGKWFACFCVENPKKETKINNGKQIGIDLGLKTFATLSDRNKIENPRHFKKLENKIAFLQKRKSRKKKGSNNRKKSVLKVARLHEKISNSRIDFLHKTSTKLVNSYSLIALEKLASQKMSEQQLGKSINDAGWGMFANMLTYKAESAGCKLIFVNPENTTKMCSQCGKLVPKTLWDRLHKCDCGLEIDRDLNASINILAKATAGIAESNASGNEPIDSSMKEEVSNWNNSLVVRRK